MRIQVGKDEKDWVDQVWTWVHAEVQAKQRVFLPAGNTPLAAYKQWTTTQTEHLHSLRFIQIDDVMNGPQRGTFKRFFMTELAPYQPQFEWIDRADQAADVAILGVGINGHVAFHEPSLPANFYSGCVPLSAETKSYLKLVEPTWGLTYGVGAFLKCGKILILARGEQKQKVLRQAAKSHDLPIGWIMQHPNVTLISDFSL